MFIDCFCCSRESSSWPLGWLGTAVALGGNLRWWGAVAEGCLAAPAGPYHSLWHQVVAQLTGATTFGVCGSVGGRGQADCPTSLASLSSGKHWGSLPSYPAACGQRRTSEWMGSLLGLATASPTALKQALSENSGGA